MAGKSLFRAQAPQSAPHLTVVGPGASRVLMLDHYEQYLRTATNRNKRPFASDTINAYLRCARQLARWLDEAGVPGDLTAACDPEVFNAFLREYLGGHELNGTSFLQRNLRTLFKWLERETEVPSPFRSEVLDHYVARLHKPKTLTREFVGEVLASCDEKTFVGIRDEGIIRLLLEGLRVGEVADVEPGDIPTLAERILRVTPHKGELRYAEGSGRRILLEEETIKALHRYLRARAEHPLAATHLARYLWLGQGSALPFGYNGIRLMLIRRCKRLGYDVHATPQMFRHTFAHDFRANGGAVDDLVEHGKDMAENRAIQAKRDLGPLY